MLELPRDSRVEYKIEVIRGDHVESIQDPLNPHTARDPFGANSVLQTDGYERPAWTLPDPEARTGTLVAHRSHSPALGREVDLDLYLPARFRPTRRYPLLVVHDGRDYLDYSSMQAVLDNLIHRLEMAEIVVAFTNPPDGWSSTPTTSRTPATSPRSSCPGWSRVPAGRHTRRTGPDGRELRRGRRRSRAACRYPGLFGRLLLQSGSFAFTDIGASERGPLFAPIVAIVNDFRAEPEAVQRAGLRQLRHATSR